MSKAKTLATTVSTGGVLADGTVAAAEVSGLAAVATSGAYGDLSGQPTLPSGTIVGTSDTQTLTNKTIAFANNTLTGVQPTLVSGTNIRTVGGQSLLGSGDVAVASSIQQFTASGSITAGNAVQINANGTVSVPTLSINTTLGTSAAVSGNANTYSSLVYHTASGRYMLFWRRNSDSHLYGSLGTPNADGTISWGAEINISNQAVSSVAAVYNSAAERVLLVSNPSGTIICWSIGVSNNALSVGGSMTTGQQPSDADEVTLAYDPNIDRVLITFVSASTNTLQAALISMSGTNATLITTSNSGSLVYEPNVFYHPGMQRFIVFSRFLANNLYAIVVTATATTVSWGSAQLMDTLGEPGLRMGFAYSPTVDRAVVTYRDEGTSFNVRTAVLTYSGTTLALNNIVEITSSDQGNNTACVFDASTQRFLAVYYTDTNTFTACRTGTLSGNAVSWGAETIIFSRAGSSPLNAVYDPLNGRVAVAQLTTPNLDTRTVRLGSTSVTSTNFIGFAQSTVTDGQTVNVACVGGSDNNQSGLTPATKYYVTGSGGVSTTVNDIYAGVAVSATRLLVKG